MPFLNDVYLKNKQRARLLKTGRAAISYRSFLIENLVAIATAIAASATVAISATTSTSAASAEATTSTTAATFTSLRSWASFRNRNGATFELATVELADRVGCFLVRRHLDEAEAFATARVTVQNHFCRFDRTSLSEMAHEAGIRCGKRKVTYKQSFTHLVISFSG
jgi:hypothetical protein